MTLNPQDLLDKTELSRLLNVCPGSYQLRVKQGRIPPPLRWLGHLPVWHRAAVLKWIAERDQGAAA